MKFTSKIIISEVIVLFVSVWLVLFVFRDNHESNDDDVVEETVHVLVDDMGEDLPDYLKRLNEYALTQQEFNLNQFDRLRIVIDGDQWRSGDDDVVVWMSDTISEPRLFTTNVEEVEVSIYGSEARISASVEDNESALVMIQLPAKHNLDRIRTASSNSMVTILAGCRDSSMAVLTSGSLTLYHSHIADLLYDMFDGSGYTNHYSRNIRGYGSSVGSLVSLCGASLHNLKVDDVVWSLDDDTNVGSYSESTEYVVLSDNTTSGSFVNVTSLKRINNQDNEEDE